MLSTEQYECRGICDIVVLVCFKLILRQLDEDIVLVRRDKLQPLDPLNSTTDQGSGSASYPIEKVIHRRSPRRSDLPVEPVKTAAQ